ncbi:MAG: hypothetical protein JWN00_1556 [Actinomycetia bacterium]|nr:hypothetical protein [Actinomycetes bacterium]
MPKELLVQALARNNAQWCAAMSRSHGLPGEFTSEAWTAPSRTPMYYPDAVTLVPGADPAALTARIDTATPGASIKDSFADLDLTQAGFQILFEAQWIHRPANTAATAPDLAWNIAVLARIGALTVRIITANITVTCADGTTWTAVYRLATTFTDHRRYRAETLIALYHEQWEHEVTYLALRHTLLKGRVLRSRDPVGLRQELWALLTVYQLLRIAMVTAIETVPAPTPTPTGPASPPPCAPPKTSWSKPTASSTTSPSTSSATSAAQSWPTWPHPADPASASAKSNHHYPAGTRPTPQTPTPAPRSPTSRSPAQHPRQTAPDLNYPALRVTPESSAIQVDLVQVLDARMPHMETPSQYRLLGAFPRHYPEGSSGVRLGATGSAWKA